MIDLGIVPTKETKGSCEPCNPCGGNEDKKDEPCYPTFSIDGAGNVDKLKDVLGNCKVGEEYTAVIKFRLNAIQDTKWNKSFGFDLMGIDEVESEYVEEEETPSKKKAVDKAIAKKK